jgi:hypothetical protein
MKTRFEWRTEEALRAGMVTAVSRRRPWRNVLVTLLALALAGGVIYAQGKRRVAEAISDVEEAVLAAHSLIRLAEQNQDTELFTLVLADDDPVWRFTQTQLMTTGLLWNRPPFGLQAQVAKANEPVDITLAPDLESAELRFDQAYEALWDQAAPETVWLAHTTVYQLHGDNWHLAPPNDAFWGPWRTRTEPSITIAYRHRDRLVAERLVTDLNAVLDEMCQILSDINCQADMRVRMRLDDAPSSLLAMTDEAAILKNGLHLNLPTPTLVGSPVDEAGYTALYQGYAAQVVTAVITWLVGYDCCDQELFYRALLDKQLDQLGLRPWPLTPTVYEQMLATHFFPERTRFLWSLPAATAENWLQVYSLVDFILEEVAPQSSPAQFQRQVNQTPSYWRWQGQFMLDNFDKEWARYVYQQTDSAQEPAPPIPWPDQDIQIVCRRQELHRYHLLTNTWSQPYTSHNPSSSIRNLAFGDGYIIEERGEEDGQNIMRLTRWHQGEAQNLFESADSDTKLFFTDLVDPTGRYLVMSAYFSRQAQQSELQLLDTHHCTGGKCTLQPIQQWPLWTPDGSHTLLYGNGLRPSGAEYEKWFVPLARGDAGGQVKIKLGSAAFPFWLDNEVYGYVRLGDDGEPELVTANIYDDRVRVWLRASDLLAALPENSRPEQLLLWSATANPVNPNEILVVASPERAWETPSYYFLVQAGDISLLFQSADNALNAYRSGTASFSPDGRLARISLLERLNDKTINRTTRFFHLMNRPSQTISTSEYWADLNWSAGGQWLVQTRRDFLLVMAPAHNYQRLIPYDSDNCHSAMWVKR